MTKCITVSFVTPVFTLLFHVKVWKGSVLLLPVYCVPKANLDNLSFHSGKVQDVDKGDHSICKSVPNTETGMKIFTALKISFVSDQYIISVFTQSKQAALFFKHTIYSMSHFSAVGSQQIMHTLRANFMWMRCKNILQLTNSKHFFWRVKQLSQR